MAQITQDMQARSGTRGNLYLVPLKAKEASDLTPWKAKLVEPGFLWMHVLRPNLYVDTGVFNKGCIFPSRCISNLSGCWSFFTEINRKLVSEISIHLSKLTETDPWEKQEEGRTSRQCNHLRPFHLGIEKVKQKDYE